MNEYKRSRTEITIETVSVTTIRKISRVRQEVSYPNRDEDVTSLNKTHTSSVFDGEPNAFAQIFQNEKAKQITAEIEIDNSLGSQESVTEADKTGETS